MNITLLENHWYDATFSPSARFGRDDEGEHEDATAPDGEEHHGNSRARQVAVVGMVPMIVAGIAVGVVAARRIQARRAARADELRQIEVDAIEYANAIEE
ncbi:hypothetical protein [Haloglomus litoreum]|uniref:hypothetical protein n=1 Tax=Haloglomus litoreum TaxID=3034026 RepID=UPI0023E83898|nr:hypothetical protein [Haloglomus sp. DT116]